MSNGSEKGRLKNILLVAITRMGDMLQASPTIMGLREENPDARITVLIDKQFAKICAGIPGIDEVYVIDLSMICRCLHREKDGIVDAFRNVTEMVDDLRAKNFDYCLNMSSSAYTALLIKMLDIKESRGWVSDDEGYRVISDPWAMLFAAFVYHSNRDFNGINLVDIFRCAAGVRAHPNRLVYRVAESAAVEGREFLRQQFSSDGPLICIQAGASQEKRQWPVEKFAALSRMMVDELGARVLYTGSPTEVPLIEAIIQQVNHPQVKSAAGRTSFETLGGLLSEARVLVTGDTGPMHLAVSVGTPVVAMFLASALCFETGPYSSGNFVIQPRIACHPCNPNFPCARPDCHHEVTPELVAYLTRRRIELSMGEELSERIPSSLADPRLVSVYATAFDEDNFLRFVLLNEEHPRKGMPLRFFDTAREAYGRLWKEEFDAVEGELLSVREDEELVKVPPSLAGLGPIVALSEKGRGLLRKLNALIADPNTLPAMLGETGSEIERVDKDIEEVGLAYPVLGALVRIFVMEKENLQGSDPLLLASETDRLYSRLAFRAKKFGKLFAYYDARS